MRDELFDTGPPDNVPRDVLRDAYRWGKAKFASNPERWNEPEMVEVRKHIGPPFLLLSTHELRSQLIRARQDKVFVTETNKPDLGLRMWKTGRDHARQRAREGREHTAEYERYLLSPAWRERVSRHRAACSGRCQLCGRAIHPLEGHHTAEGYEHLGREEDVHLLSLCAHCHLVADCLRETGQKVRKPDPGNGLMDGNGEADWKRISEIFGIDLDEDDGDGDKEAA